MSVSPETITPAPTESPLQPASDASGAPVGLTAKAAEKGDEIRGEESIEDTYGLRVTFQGGVCSGSAYDLYFDLPQDIDHSFDSHGVKLLCDQRSLMYLMGT